ncbi:hypothetical protein FOCC_FOCC008330 [Frankliniella occidentalis]|uniref:HSPB1-associated protein 1 n=1 Tax=Frankliniella occidentalis TaxID=133901 RepID=A0A9C6WX95_FRAOC|nr:HSPB1-associated protein 1 [Frankliniella occidentalis]KAE8745018.1 hypothetical protein FOCC_FOCC008330 [Frankliniella occidentalis]
MSEGKKLSKEVVVSLSEPVIFHGMIENWSVLKWELKDWSSVFGERKLPFRCGVKSCSPDPLWEGKCSKEMMTLEEFCSLKLEHTEPTEDGMKWFYFDYQQISDWTSAEINDLISIKWDAFGFPEKGAEDSTIWIGSEGAHTPCHFDTYGCNLVAQVIGTKRWILFPHEDMKDMRPTRVPYEESSVYSLWNFNCPLPSEFYSRRNCKAYIVDLKPGDVLFVPRHWWHYVESLDFSISINTWLPTNPEDDVSRLDEAFVQLLISQVSKNLSTDEKSKILNPNENDVVLFDLQHSASIISHCANNVKQFRRKCSELKEPPAKQLKMESSDQIELSSLLEMGNAKLVSSCNSEQLRSLMDTTCSCASKERHAMAMTQRQASDFNSHVKNLINAFCHPDIVAQVREKFNDVFVLDDHQTTDSETFV